MNISDSELQLKLESMEEQLTRQKQVLREATAKHQNLIRHLKLIEAESGRIMYDETNVAHIHSTEDLQRLVELNCDEITFHVQAYYQLLCYLCCRDVCAVEQALKEKEARDEKLRQDMQREKEKVQRSIIELFCENLYLISSLRGTVVSTKRPVLRLMKSVRSYQTL